MKLIYAMVIKEFLQLRRDPRLIGFIIVMPVVLLFLFGYALQLEPENVQMAYVDKDKSLMSDLVKTGIWSEGYFRLYEVDSESEILEEIRLGRARAGLYIGKDFSRELTDNAQPTVKVYVDGTMPSLATAMDNNTSVITSESVTSDMYFLPPDAPNTVIADDPFVLDVVTLYNPDGNEVWFFLPGIVGVLIMQVALILTSTSIVRERENNTIEQLIASPITRLEFILGKTIPYVLIAFVDFYLILVIGNLLFAIPGPTSQLTLLLLAVVYVVSLIAMGLAISTFSKTQQQAIFMSIFILIPSILLSGFIFPIEAMPELVQPVSWILPFTYFVEIIRGLLLKGNSLSELIHDFMALGLFASGFTVFSVLRFRKTL